MGIVGQIVIKRHIESPPLCHLALGEAHLANQLAHDIVHQLIAQAIESRWISTQFRLLLAIHVIPSLALGRLQAILNATCRLHRHDQRGLFQRLQRSIDPWPQVVFLILQIFDQQISQGFCTRVNAVVNFARQFADHQDEGEDPPLQELFRRAIFELANLGINLLPHHPAIDQIVDDLIVNEIGRDQTAKRLFCPVTGRIMGDTQLVTQL